MSNVKPPAAGKARTSRAGRPKKDVPRSIEARRGSIEDDARRRAAIGDEVKALLLVQRLLDMAANALLSVEETRKKRAMSPMRIDVALDPSLARVRDALRDLARGHLEALAKPQSGGPPQLTKAIEELSKPPAPGTEALSMMVWTVWVAMTLVRKELAGTIATEGISPDDDAKAVANVLHEEGLDDREIAIFILGERDHRQVENFRRYVSSWRREYRKNSGDVLARVREVIGTDVDGLVDVVGAEGIDRDAVRGRLERLLDPGDHLLDGLLQRWNLTRSAPTPRRKVTKGSKTSG